MSAKRSIMPGGTRLAALIALAITACLFAWRANTLLTDGAPAPDAHTLHNLGDGAIHYTILVSASMGEANLKALFRSLAHRQDVSFAIRGLLPEEKTINPPHVQDCFS